MVVYTISVSRRRQLLSTLTYLPCQEMAPDLNLHIPAMT